MSKTKKVTKKINKEDTKSKRSQSKEQNGKSINVQELQESLSYLHPKNRLTKKVYETVCKMQELISNKVMDFEFAVDFRVAERGVNITLMSKNLGELELWNSNEGADDELNAESLLKGYRTHLLEVLQSLTCLYPEDAKQTIEEVVDMASVADQTENIHCDYFIGRYCEGDVGEYECESLSDMQTLGYLLATAPPNELPNIPNTYFIFRMCRPRSDECLPKYRWTKKARWKKARKNDLCATLIES